MTGTFLRAVDDKLRLAIPKRLRDALIGEGKPELYVTPGIDGSLAIYNTATLDRLARRLAESSPTKNEVRSFNRLFYARAECVEIDGQGRVRLPPALAELAGLTKEAVLLGVHDHLEIWDRARWEAYLGDHAQRYDEIAEQAFQPRVDA
ncbi:MAG TPA: division/cell wall cluster transcriptional repressor MraZ [Pirellulales bacterium]|nr:division/cell wall cluster transcriptional repressor MraZ [Pirellulales bacterium]